MVELAYGIAFGHGAHAHIGIGVVGGPRSGVVGLHPIIPTHHVIESAAQQHAILIVEAVPIAGFVRRISSIAPVLGSIHVGFPASVCRVARQLTHLIGASRPSQLNQNIRSYHGYRISHPLIGRFFHTSHFYVSGLFFHLRERTNHVHSAGPRG